MLFLCIGFCTIHLFHVGVWTVNVCEYQLYNFVVTHDVRIAERVYFSSFCVSFWCMWILDLGHFFVQEIECSLVFYRSCSSCDFWITWINWDSLPISLQHLSETCLLTIAFLFLKHVHFFQRYFLISRQWSPLVSQVLRNISAYCCSSIIIFFVLFSYVPIPNYYIIKLCDEIEIGYTLSYHVVLVVMKTSLLTHIYFLWWHCQRILRMVVWLFLRGTCVYQASASCWFSLLCSCFYYLVFFVVFMAPVITANCWERLLFLQKAYKKLLHGETAVL